MPKVATLTLRQLSVLRLVLRLQKVKSFKRGLNGFKAGSPEHQVIYDLLKRQDELTGLDIGLMLLEAKVYKETGGDPLTTTPVVLSDEHLALALASINSHYGADAAFGGQADQAYVLQIISAEQEGIRLALQTSTDSGTPPLQVLQPMPKGRQ
jgi:hypothetical protein